MLHGLDFGAPLYYCDPAVPGLKTRCVFIRHDGDAAVVMFADLDQVARVDYEQLAWRDPYE